MDDFTLGSRELDIMAVLWEIGSGTVSEVRERLPADLAYTTVLTILRKLEAKGFLKHKVEGKAHRYVPKLARRTARASALGRVLDTLFDGSPDMLLAHLVDAHQVSADELKRMRKRLAAHARSETRGDT
ncbi:MAG TPA: BlaI/MecI/CopY family transcriptional regulator [Gemmatimonadaceae bacterium]|nr:BlaI/MecI/CopY family transcriptional regulator [Gemmatimonadaceae bacterium]